MYTISETLGFVRDLVESRNRHRAEAYSCWRNAARWFADARRLAPRGTWGKTCDAAGLPESVRAKLRASADWADLKASKDVLHRANTRQRLKYEMLATPPWAADDEAELIAIERVHLAAERLASETGVDHEIDHIVALRTFGEVDGRRQLVACGLHVSWNLQPLPKHRNRDKSSTLQESAACGDSSDWLT